MRQCHSVSARPGGKAENNAGAHEGRRRSDLSQLRQLPTAPVAGWHSRSVDDAETINSSRGWRGSDIVAGPAGAEIDRSQHLRELSPGLRR